MPRRSSLWPLSILRSLILPLLLTVFCPLFAAAQAKPVDAQGHRWWQHAVHYGPATAEVQIQTPLFTAQSGGVS